MRKSYDGLDKSKYASSYHTTLARYSASVVGTEVREVTSYAEAGEGKEEQGVSTISDTTSEVL